MLEKLLNNNIEKILKIETFWKEVGSIFFKKCVISPDFQNNFTYNLMLHKNYTSVPSL